MVDEFLAWAAADASGVRWQLRDGVPAALAPASDAHGSILGEATRLVGNALVARGGPGRAVIFPRVVPRVAALRNLRIADLGVTCSPPSDGAALPSPILLVEVVSPEEEAEARANVWAYTTVPTVREVLLLDGRRVGAELWQRSGDGT